MFSVLIKFIRWLLPENIKNPIHIRTEEFDFSWCGLEPGTFVIFVTDSAWQMPPHYICNDCWNSFMEENEIAIINSVDL